MAFSCRIDEVRQKLRDAPNLILRMTIEFLPKVRIAKLFATTFFIQQLVRREIQERSNRNQ